MNPLLWVVRRAAAAPWPPLLLALSTAVLVFLVTLVPRIADDLDARTLSGVLGTVSAQQGDLTAQWRSSPGLDDPAADPAAVYLDNAEAVRAGLPAPLSALLAPPQLVAELGFPISMTPPVSSGYYRVSADVLVDATLGDHAGLVSGAWPAPPTPGAGPTEVAVLDEVAERMGWSVGEEALPGTLISGTFAPTDPEDPRWEHNPRGVRYVELADPNLGTELSTAVFLDPAALAVGALGGRPQIQYRLWVGLDLGGVAGGGTDPDLLSSQLTGLLARSHTLPGDDDVPPVDIRLFSELNSTLASVALQQRALRALVAALATGPLTVALLVVVVACRTVSRRRATVAALLVARGASASQLYRHAGAEACCLAAVGALVGHLSAAAVLPRDSMAWQWGATAVVTVAVAAGAAALISRPPSDRPGDRGRGMAAEAGVALLALTATAMLLLGDTSDGRVDVLAASAPVLLALLGAAVLRRMLPLPLGRLSHRLRAGRELAPMLGVARAVRDPAGGAISLVAVVAGVSMAFVGAAVSGSLAGAADLAAWSANGADLNLAGPRMTDDVVARIRQVDGVEHVARITRLTDAAAVGTPSGDGHVGVWAVEPEVLDVYRGTPLDPGIPSALFDAGEPPAVLLGGEAPAAEGTGTLSGLGAARFVGHRERLPGVGTQPAWALVSTDAWGEAGGEPATATLALVSVAEGAAPEVVAATIRDQLGTAVVTTVDEQLRGRGIPAAAEFGRAVSVASVVTMMLMVVAVLGAEAVGAGARRRDLDVLAALGMGAGDRRRAVLWEVAPTLGLSMTTGAALGVGIAALLLAALDFSFITGDAAMVLTFDRVRTVQVAALALVSFVIVVATAGGRSRPVTPREDA